MSRGDISDYAAEDEAVSTAEAILDLFIDGIARRA